MLRRALLVSSLASVLCFGLVPGASAHGLGWTDQFGSVVIDAAWSVAVESGAIYVAGQTQGSLPGKTSAGGVDGFLVKYDSTGGQVWARQFGTAEDDVAFGVAADGTGIYVAGYTDGEFPGETQKGSSDGFLRKFSPAGTALWTVQFGTDSVDVGNSVAVGPSGVSIAGATRGTFPGQRRHGRADAYVIQFDTSGSRLWVRQFGSTEYDNSLAIAEDAARIVVSGITYGKLPGQSARGDVDAFVAAFAPDGSRRWIHQFGTIAYDDSYGVNAFGGVIYVAGTTEGALPGQRNRGSGDAFVRAYKANGSGLWTSQFGTDGNDRANMVAADATGVYVVGQTAGLFAHQTYHGANDAFLRAFDAAGTGMWTSQFGSTGPDAAWWDATDGAGTIYVVGNVNGAMPTQNVIGELDAFVAQVA